MPPFQPEEISANLMAQGHKYAIVLSKYNSLITNELLGGALDTLQTHGAAAKDQKIVRVPGGFEIPLAVRELILTKKFDGIIALGCVIKGSTDHDQYISAEVTKGISHLSLEYGIPVSFGVLTPNSLEQALERAGSKMGNKGSEAALAAIEMVNLIRLLRKK